MGLYKPHRLIFLLLLILICSAFRETSRAEARSLPTLLPHRRERFGIGYTKIFATLGVVCKCCDGVAQDSGEESSCRASWDGSCSNLRCLPWKLW